MKVHNDLKELLADFSIYHHGWLLDKNDNRTFTELTSDYLSANSLALGKPEPLAKNKQTKEFCEWCGTKLTYKVETDANSEKVCRYMGCPAK